MAVHVISDEEPHSPPATASDAECLRPPKRAMLTADAALYARIGTIFGSGNSRAATRASAHDLMECPDGNASPPLVDKRFKGVVQMDRRPTVSRFGSYVNPGGIQ